jgi:hypothetical protein
VRAVLVDDGQLDVTAERCAGNRLPHVTRMARSAIRTLT